MTKLTKEERLTQRVAKLEACLKRIAKGYSTTNQLRRSCGNDYGLGYCEALEMAYENIQQEAKYALKKRYSKEITAWDGQPGQRSMRLLSTPLSDMSKNTIREF